MIVALAGGVGGARLAVGLTRVLTPRKLSFVINTGDDFEHLGLTVCPDLDTVMYTLAGVANPETSWGRADEGWRFMEALTASGGPAWFKLGDRDLATHVLRTEALRRGAPLSEITARLARQLGVRHALLPMSETPVRTQVLSGKRVLAFQEYFVRLQCVPRVSGFRLEGLRRARPPAALNDLMKPGRTRGLVLCPSNPYVSIAPILALPYVRRWLRNRTFPVVAVSPIVGGTAIKGPAAKMLRELGAEASALAVARHYGDLVDGWVIDERDAGLRGAIESLHKTVVVCNTVMTSPAITGRLAKVTVDLVRELRRQRRPRG